MVYAEMLGERIKQHNTRVYLVNTGWTGGPYGIGQRINLDYTRSMVTAVLNGQLDQTDYIADPVFNLCVPTHCPGVPDHLLNPRNTWQDREAYDRKANELAKRFLNNFSKFSGIPEQVLEAGPKK